MPEAVLALVSVSVSTLSFPLLHGTLGFFLCFLQSFFCLLFSSCSFSSFFSFLSIFFFSRSSCSSCFFLSFSSIWANEDALVSNLARGKASSTLAGVNVPGCTNISAKGLAGSNVGVLDLVVVLGATRRDADESRD